MKRKARNVSRLKAASLAIIVQERTVFDEKRKISISNIHYDERFDLCTLSLFDTLSPTHFDA